MVSFDQQNFIMFDGYNTDEHLECSQSRKPDPSHSAALITLVCSRLKAISAVEWKGSASQATAFLTFSLLPGIGRDWYWSE